MAAIKLSVKLTIIDGDGIPAYSHIHMLSALTNRHLVADPDIVPGKIFKHCHDVKHQ
jgi:hypothetical protein